MTAPSGDNGLQPQRTALAWQRTAIGAVVVLLPVLLVDARLGSWPLVVLGSGSVLSAVALVARTVPRLRHLHRPPEAAHGAPSPYPPMQAVALVATLAAAGAVATALTVLLAGAGPPSR